MDREQAFDEDYLHFYEPLLTDERSDAEAGLIRSLLRLEEGAEVLDLACGHGRIANRLAARGLRVTGLDATPLFLELAREDARRRGVEVEYVLGDMREPPWQERFDAVLSWFTSFGYFDDDGNREVLAGALRALRAGGTFLVELNNRDWIMRNYRDVHVNERDGDWLVDRASFDVGSGANVMQRTVLRGGRSRTFEVRVRMFTFTELREWLERAGFVDVRAFGRDGEPLRLDHSRMLALGSKPV
jgi:SAM-dependent methyltransferase